jgi:hypothetical protein
VRARPDPEKIARELGAERRGAVRAAGGVFGAAQLAAEIQARFRAPAGGGRSTDPSWSEKCLVSLTPETLQRLSRLSEAMNERGVTVSPLQLAALLLERAVVEADEDTPPGRRAG